MKRHSRRGFITSCGAAGAGLLTAATPAAPSTAHHPNNNEVGMLYDATKCVGCKACMAVCKRVNAHSGALAYERASFDKHGLWEAPEDLSGNTRTVIKLARDQETWSYVKYACMHCQKPSCVSVCPVRAMVKDPVTGIVDYEKSTCIGCRYCQIACQFNIPKFQWDRTVPQIVKCDLCRDTNLKEKGIPACAEVCPTEALLFGKRADLLRQAKTRLEEHADRYHQHIYGEHEAGGTNILFLAAVPFEMLGLPRLPSQAPAILSEKIQHTIYKGFIAPVVLFATLCGIALSNQKKRAREEAGLNSHPHAPAEPN